MTQITTTGKVKSSGGTNIDVVAALHVDATGAVAGTQDNPLYVTVGAPAPSIVTDDAAPVSLANTTETTLIAAPGAGLRTVLDFVSIYNADNLAHVYAIRTETGGPIRAYQSVPAATAAAVPLPGDGIPSLAQNANVTVQIVDSNAITTASKVTAHGVTTSV